jgi:hypothetical protein
VHEVSVQAHDDGAAGQAESDLAFAAGDQHVAVALDFAVGLDGLPGGRTSWPLRRASAPAAGAGPAGRRRA